MINNDLEKEYDKLEKKERPFNKIKAFRDRYGVTQIKLAQELDREERIIRHYEKGTAPIPSDVLIRLEKLEEKYEQVRKLIREYEKLNQRRKKL